MLEKVQKALEYFSVTSIPPHEKRLIEEASKELDEYKKKLESGELYLSLISEINATAKIKIATLGNPYVANADEIAQAAIKVIKDI